MADGLNDIERIPEPLRGAIHEYVELLRELGGDNLRALTFYGAVVAGTFNPDRHSAQNVLVLGRVDLGMLRRLAEHGRKLGKQRIRAPLIMTPEYIGESADTFPLELLEIQQQHATLFGDDYFADLPLERSHVRLQCERELKSILIGLRQGLLAAAGRDKMLNLLEADVAAGLLRTLRGMLWLKDDKTPKPAPAVVAAVEKLTNHRLDGLRSALEPDASHDWSTFERLYDNVTTLGSVVDAW